MLGSKLKKYLIRNKVKTYNISGILKYLTGYPNWLYLPFNIHHGWYTSVLPRERDLNPKTYPLMLVWNKRQKEIWKKYSNISVECIGAPFIHYRRKKNILPSANAKGTIVFPAHSSKNTTIEYDIESFCTRLLSLPIQYHPISVCLHYYDYNGSFKKLYEDKGFKVFTAGHVHSSQFVDNFYDILKAHKYSTSNSIGTYVMYSIELGIPFFLYGEPTTLVKRAGHDGGGVQSVKPEADKLFSYTVSEVLDGVTIKDEQESFIISESGVDDCIDFNQLRKVMLYNFWFKIVPLMIYRIVKLPVLGIKKVLRI